MIEFVIVSFVAGVLTVAAPCILPLLPVIVGGSVLHGASQDEQKSLKHPIIIALSLAVSIFVFSLVFKASTLLLNIPVAVWSIISGGIIVLFGVTLLFPALWEKLMVATGLQASTSRLMATSQRGSGTGKDILLGAALGPVFNSCSPTYALIVAVVLPASFTTGMLYLLAYSFGLASILLLISIFGRSLASNLKWLSNPNGFFKKIVAIVFIFVGLAVLFGLDKTAQTYVIENGWYDPVMRIEEVFRK